MSFLKRLPIYGRMVDRLLAEHRLRPYDVVIQFSQTELFKLGKHTLKIPIVLYPCVHAAGERFWCRREAPLARQCEPGWWRVLRDLYLGYRTRVQKRDYGRVRGVIGMSRRFNRWVKRDYGISEDRQGVVYHPIAIPPEQVNGSLPPALSDRIRLLFVGRISVRKGVEMLARAVPELLARHAEVEVAIIGAGSLWSDYEPLLQGLPQDRCQFLKSLSNAEVQARMRQSHILLVPSRYEPGGIVVGEALANGMIVVASDEVGSAENLSEDVCKQFPAGDQPGFMAAIERAIAAVRSGGMPLREAATRAAKEQFDPTRMTGVLLAEVQRLVSRNDGQ
jgi:glycosyltransferase involved in cell wall biosynthesis